IVITNFSYKPSELAYQSIRTCNKDSIRTDTMTYSNQNLCDSLIIINYFYTPIELTYLSKDITCYGYMDGALEISKLVNAQAPLQLILDHKVYSTQLKWNNLDKGLHTLYLIDNDGCFSDSVVLDIKEPAPIKIDIGKDLLLNKSEQIIFSEKSNIHFTSYHWNPSGLFDCATCEFAKGSISQDTTIYLMVEDENGCIASDTLNIRINKEYNYYVPNVFSPNGDNLNDRFYIYGSDNLNIQWIRIFDRWGALVFNKSNPMINHSLDGWDGTFNGEPLNPGVFTYVFSISNADGTPQIIYGDITISR
ncbi:MAG: gliding motility-associated C-terminal domain-containing protein, partial [Saprospiraceae bacterium]